MIIKRVEIKNFRSHANTKINLDEGIIAIIGGNGEGKTSILEAIGYALFRFQRNIEDLIRHGSTEMEVSVDFTALGREYRIIRGRSRGRAKKTALYELIDGKPKVLAFGDEQVKKKMESLLGINSRVFSTAIYARQGEIASLLTSTQAERQRIVGRLIGTEELEEVHKKMLSVIRHFKSKLEGYRDIDEQIEEKQNKISDLKAEIEKLLKSAEVHKKNLEKLELQKLNLEKEIAEIRQYLELEQNLNLLNSQKKLIQRELERIDEYILVEKTEKKKAEEYERLLEKRRELSEQIARADEISKTLERLSKEEIQLSKKKDEIGRFIENFLRRCSRLLEKELTLEECARVIHSTLREKEAEERELNNSVTHIKAEVGTLLARKKEMEKTLRNISELRGKCPTCGRELKNHTKEELIREYTLQLQKFTGEIAELERKLKEKQKKLLEIREFVSRLRELNPEIAISRAEEVIEIQNKLRSIRRDAEELRKMLEVAAELREKYRKLEEKLESLRSDYTKYLEAKNFLRKYLPERENLTQKLAELKKRIADISAELNNIKIKPNRQMLTSKEKELQNLTKKLDSEKKRLIFISAEIENKRIRLQEIKEELSKLQGRRKEREKLERYIQFLEQIRELFGRDSLQRIVREKAKPLIEKYTREVFETFNLPYSDLVIHDDYSISLISPLGEIKMENLSGGELVACALALRIGIARALSGPRLECIILDEPTIHLDSERRRELIEVVKRLASLPQTIVVSHDPEFQEAATKVFLVEKRAGKSQVREILPEYAQSYPQAQ